MNHNLDNNKICRHCRAIGRELTAECYGNILPMTAALKVSRGELDYFNGKWWVVSQTEIAETTLEEQVPCFKQF